MVIYKEGRACGSEEQSGDDAVKNEKSRLKNKGMFLNIQRKLLVSSLSMKNISRRIYSRKKSLITQ